MHTGVFLSAICLFLCHAVKSFHAFHSEYTLYLAYHGLYGEILPLSNFVVVHLCSCIDMYSSLLV